MAIAEQSGNRMSNPAAQESLGVTTTARRAFDSLYSRRFPAIENTPRHAAKREAYMASVTTEGSVDMNPEHDLILDGFMTIIEEAGIKGKEHDYSRPYWNQDMRYTGLDILNGLSQYADHDNYPLPKSVIPPQEDVKRFMDTVRASEKPLTVIDQFKIGMEIAGNNPVGAANLALIATRHGARGLDERATGIQIEAADITEWNSHIAKFQIYDEGGKMDGPGDTYYFWSHVFGALATETLDSGWRTKALQSVLDRGTKTMQLAREKIARWPILTPHREASMIGRQLGLAVAMEIGANPSSNKTSSENVVFQS